MKKQTSISLERFLPTYQINNLQKQKKDQDYYVSFGSTPAFRSNVVKTHSPGVEKKILAKKVTETHQQHHIVNSFEFERSPAASPVMNQHYEKIFNDQIVTDKEAQLKRAIQASKTALNKVKQRFEWMSLCIIVLFGVLSITSLVFHGVYVAEIDDHVLPELYTQDAVNVFVALPLCAISHYHTMQGNVRGFVFWMSGMSFVFYNYLIYAFETNFNTLFLGYIILITLSSFVIFGIVGTLDTRALKKHFQPRTPVVFFSLFLVAFALCKLITWIATYLAILEIHEQPAQKSAFILDLCFVVPAFILVAVMCWRQQSWGLVLTGVFLIDSVTMSCSTVAKTLTSLLCGDTHGILFTMRLYMFLTMFVLGLVMVAVYNTNLEPSMIKSAHFAIIVPSASSNMYASEANSSDESGGIHEGDISAYVSLSQVYHSPTEKSHGSGKHELVLPTQAVSPISLLRSANKAMSMPKKKTKSKELYRLNSSQSLENFYSSI